MTEKKFRDPATAESIEKQIADLEIKKRELEEQREKLIVQRAMIREENLFKLVKHLILRLENGVNISHVDEGHELKLSTIQQGVHGPRPAHNDVAVQLYSARERKGYVDTTVRPEYRNRSYRSDEVVVMQVVFPRDDVAELLEALLEALED